MEKFRIVEDRFNSFWPQVKKWYGWRTINYHGQLLSLTEFYFSGGLCGQERPHMAHEAIAKYKEKRKPRVIYQEN